jgi:hypothetical protein
MHRQPSKRKKIIRRVLTYTFMVLCVITIAVLLVSIISGYRYDAKNGRVEQSAILQFNSVPSGATVEVNDAALAYKTRTKTTVFAGTYTITMHRDGYETWQKTVAVKTGSLLWLDYARLVPKKRIVQSVASYPAIYASLAAPTQKFMLIQPSPSEPTFDLINLDDDKIKTTPLTLPTDTYSEAATPDVIHTFQIVRWDKGGRYVLIKHTYNDRSEWLSLDTSSPDKIKNITHLMEIPIDEIFYSGTSGNILYALTDSTIRKIDLSAETLSRALVNNITSFSLYEDSNVIVYTSGYDAETDKRTVGLYQEGHDTPQVLRTIKGNVPLQVVTARFYNDDYIVIAEDNAVDILYGQYPTSNNDSGKLTKFASFRLNSTVKNLSFSPNNKFIVAQAYKQFVGYDLEQGRAVQAVLNDNTRQLQWLDDNHVWSDQAGSLTMMEFDGANATSINSVVTGQTVTLNRNERYLYSIGLKKDNTYQLQRVRMILP